MYNVSDAYKTAIAQPARELHARITKGSMVYDDNYISSIGLNDGIMTGDDFEIGTAVMAMADVVLLDTDGSLANTTFENQEALIEIAVKLADGSYEYVPLGYFTVETPKRTNKKISFSACDRMYKFEKPYTSSLAYPATLLAIAQDICSCAGVTLLNTSFPNSGYSCPNAPVLDGVTCRKAIAQVAELAGGYAHITRDGKLEIKNISTTSVVNITSQRSFNNKDLPMASIDKVIVKLGAEQASAGTGSNPYYVVDNMFVNDPNSVVQALYNTLNGLTYMPCEMTFQGNPALDCGDRIAIVEKGVTYLTILASRKLTYRGGLREEYNAPGKSNTEKNSIGKGSLTIDMDQTKTEIKVMQDEIDQTVTSVTAAQNTANSKRRIFTSQPVPPYDKGDLWVSTSSSGNNMVCTTARASGSYNASDWTKDSVTQRITTAETNITQNANAITLKADKTVTDSLGNRLTTDESIITQQANQIAAKVNTADFASEITQNADSVKIAVGQIGGNNLIKDSDFEFGILSLYSLHGGALQRFYSTGVIHGLYEYKIVCNGVQSGGAFDISGLTVGITYTFSLYYLGDFVPDVLMYNQSWTMAQHLKTSDDYAIHRHSVTFICNDSTQQRICIVGNTAGTTIYVDMFQLEEGENVTAWRPNANELKSTDVTINDNGLTINNGAIAIKNNAGTTVLQGDVNGNLAINGAFITHNATMDYNGLTINNGAIAIKNNAGTTVLQGDANGNLAINGTFTADAYVDSIHKQSYIKDGEFYLHRDGYNHVGEITLNGEGMAFYSPTGFYFHHVDHSNGPITSADIYCNSVIATGSKPALVDTKDHAQQFLFSEESPEVVFRDRGHGVIGSDGTCAIFFDTVFAETVTTTQSDYYVLLTGYKGCNAEIQEKRPNYFIVCGNVDKEFDWEVICSRKGYERLRFNDVMGVNIGCLSS